MADRTLIKGGTVITVDPSLGDFPTGDVLIEDGAIVDGRRAASTPRTRRSSTRPTASCCPGLVDTHRHTWQALFRNIASDWTLAHYFTGLHGTMSQLYRPRGHLRRQPDRHARGARLRHHDAARLVAQPQHARAHRRRASRRSRVGLARGLRPRLRLRALGAGQLARPSRRRRPPPARGPVLLLRRQLVTLAMAPRGNQFATLEVTRARLRARGRARHPHQLPRRRRRVGQGPADRAAARARPARPDADLRPLQLARRRRAAR